MSEANLEAMRAERIEYVIAERLRRHTANAALARAGRYKRVSRNLAVKEIVMESAERVLVCRNRERALEDARQRDAIVERPQMKIAAGGVRDQLKARITTDHEEPRAMAHLGSYPEASVLLLRGAESPATDAEVRRDRSVRR